MPLILHTGLSVHKEKMIKEMRLTVKDFFQHSTNTLSVMKAQYKKELLKRAKRSPSGAPGFGPFMIHYVVACR